MGVSIREQGYKPGIMIGKATAYIDPTYIPAVGGLANGIVTASEFNPGTKGKEISDAFEEEYGVAMNGHSAEAYTAVWLLKTAIEQAETADRAGIKAALDAINIDGSFPGGEEIILPYDHISFGDVDMNGTAHVHTNADACVTIIQIQDGVYKTVWPFEIKEEEVLFPAPFA